MRRVLIIIAILLIPAIPIVLVVSGVIKKKPITAPPVALTVWGTEDNDKALAGTIAQYRATHPYVTITYQKAATDDYFQNLLQAWSQGTGPDIFFVPNAWIGQMTSYGIPMPANLTIPVVRTTKGVFGVSRTVINQPLTAPSLSSIHDTFVDAVGNDIDRDGQIWALPLSMDTIVTYYNKDLLNNAKIFEPAKTWPELASQVSGNHLTVTDAQGNLVRSATALGTSNNVPYATDLLTLLMLQNGATMTTADRHASFNQPPGLIALNFYTSFAQSTKTTYSWDGNQTNGRDAFLQGKVAYYFGTLDDRSVIAAGNLNWGVSPMLHLSSSGDNDSASGGERFIDVARYQVGMVSRAAATAGRGTVAWNFLQFASQANNVSSFLKVTGGLSAQKSILVTQKDDPRLTVFAGQLLTAKTWYHGTGGQVIEGYFKDLISSVVSGKASAQEALDLAAKQVESTL